jgi:type I restriction enzyme M protein
MIESLKPSGICGVIVNEGLLFNRNKSSVALRKLLLEKMELQAVVSLPQGVFRPYSGVKTSFLIFKNTGKPTKKVWFYEVENDGYTKGTRRKPQPSKNDLPDLLLKWSNREESDKSWNIDIEKVKKSDYILTAPTYRCAVSDMLESYREPIKIWKDIQKLDSMLKTQKNRVKESI